MSFSPFLNGKTIAQITDRAGEYEGIDIVFTDGTALRIQGDGYETSTVTQYVLTAEDLRLEAKEARGRREVDRVRRLAREMRTLEDLRLEASMTPPEWVAWRDKYRPGWRFALMVQEEVQGAYLDLMRSVNRQFVSVVVEPGSIE